MDFNLSSLFFYCRNGSDARKSWLSYVSSIDKAICDKLNELLPDSMCSTNIDNDIELLLQQAVNQKSKISVACIQISVIILCFYNNEHKKCQDYLLSTKTWLINEASNNIVTKISDWIMYLFNCYLALLFDIISYPLKVIIHPTSWFSSKKRDKLAESCNSLRQLESAHSRKKAEEKILSSLKKQVVSSLKIYKEISTE